MKHPLKNTEPLKREGRTVVITLDKLGNKKYIFLLKDEKGNQVPYFMNYEILNGTPKEIHKRFKIRKGRLEYSSK